MNEDLLNVFGSFSEISLDCIEKQNEEIEQLKRNCNIGNENLKFYKQENQQLKDRIEKAVEKINFYETTEWGLKSYEILELFREILKGDRE